MIRPLKFEDLHVIKRIHEEYYKEEFDFPNFFDKFLGVFVVTDDSTDELLTVGGIRTIAESVIITNKGARARNRRFALYQMLQASLFTCSRLGYHELHAFIQDEKWVKHLMKVGFKPTVGKPLVLGL
jgi:hypothetical protein